MDERFGVDVVYLDYSKAFGSICIDVKLSFQPISKGGIKWPVIQVSSSTKWCYTGVCFGTSFICSVCT